MKKIKVEEKLRSKEKKCLHISPVEIFLCALTGFGDECRGVALPFDAKGFFFALPETALLSHDALLSLQAHNVACVNGFYRK